MSRCGECRACKIEDIGCACDGALDSGCFLCNPTVHERPECPSPKEVTITEPTNELLKELEVLHTTLEDIIYALCAEKTKDVKYADIAGMVKRLREERDDLRTKMVDELPNEIWVLEWTNDGDKWHPLTNGVYSDAPAAEHAAQLLLKMTKEDIYVRAVAYVPKVTP